MPNKKKPARNPGIRESLNYHPITPEQVDGIVQATGKEAVNLDWLEYELDEAAQEFLHAHYQEGLMPPFEARNRLKKIAQKARELLGALPKGGTLDDSVIASFLKPERDGTPGIDLDGLIATLQSLRTLAEKAGSEVMPRHEKAERLRLDMGMKPEPRNNGCPPLRGLMDRLVEGYSITFAEGLADYGDFEREFLERLEAVVQSPPPDTETETETEPSMPKMVGLTEDGPLFRFIAETLKAIKENLDPQTRQEDPTVGATLSKAGTALGSEVRRALDRARVRTHCQIREKINLI